MAAACNSARAAGLALAATLAVLPAIPPAMGQQNLDQPVYVPPTDSRIETMPLPPIGGDAGEEPGGAAGTDAGTGAGPDSEGGTLPQPRFVRVPSVADQSEAAARDGALGGGAQDQGWERSDDGRFHRAPPAAEPGGSEALAPAPVVPIDPPQTDLRTGARLRELDKMTGQTKTFELGVGETREIDRLRIELEACRSPEGNDVHGTMAFLKVWDTRSPEAEAFSGWMFAESPAISAMDHPRYDLWVISCTTSAVATSGPSE